MRGNPLNGFRYLVSGLSLLLRPGLRRFVIVPVLVNIIVFALLIWGGVILFSDLMVQLLPEDSWLSHLSWLLWPLFAITAVLVVFYTFTAVANLIASPFNSLLAEKTEMMLTGKPLDDSTGWSQVLKELVPGMLSELRKLLYFILRAIPLLILFLIPGLNLAAPFLWLAFSAWYLSLEYVDFPMGNHGILFKQQRQHLLTRRLTAFGFGAGVLVLMAIPLVNFVAMPAGVVGATLLWREEFAEK